MTSTNSYSIYLLSPLLIALSILSEIRSESEGSSITQRVKGTVFDYLYEDPVPEAFPEQAQTFRRKVPFVEETEDLGEQEKVVLNPRDTQQYLQHELIFSPGSEDELRVSPDGTATFTEDVIDKAEGLIGHKKMKRKDKIAALSKVTALTGSVPNAAPAPTGTDFKEAPTNNETTANVGPVISAKAVPEKREVGNRNLFEDQSEEATVAGGSNAKMAPDSITIQVQVVERKVKRSFALKNRLGETASESATKNAERNFEDSANTTNNDNNAANGKRSSEYSGDYEEDDYAELEDKLAPVESIFSSLFSHGRRRQRREIPTIKFKSLKNTGNLLSTIPHRRYQRSAIDLGKIVAKPVMLSSRSHNEFLDLSQIVSMVEGDEYEERKARQTVKKLVSSRYKPRTNTFPSAFCTLEKDTGVLCPGIKRGAFFDQFYYDTRTNQCSSFVYNGCGGNANRFSTLWECNQFCGKVQKS